MKKIFYSDLAEILCISEITLRTHIQNGDLPPPTHDNENNLFFNEKEIIEKLKVKDLDEPFITATMAISEFPIKRKKLKILLSDTESPITPYRVRQKSKILLRRSELVFLEKAKKIE